MSMPHQLLFAFQDEGIAGAVHAHLRTAAAVDAGRIDAATEQALRAGGAARSAHAAVRRVGREIFAYGAADGLRAGAGAHAGIASLACQAGVTAGAAVLLARQDVDALPIGPAWAKPRRATTRAHVALLIRRTRLAAGATVGRTARRIDAAAPAQTQPSGEHLPSEQTKPAAHAVPQAPQFLASDAVLTHAPLQVV
jgi:hypothetical protein